MDGLAGNTAIVTGAAQGLGLAAARRLAEEGANLVVGDLQAEKLASAVAGLEAGGAAVSAVSGDLRESVAAESLVRAALDRFGRVDILVNCAGGSGDVGIADIEELTEDAWDRVVDSNLKATYLCARAAVGSMKAQGSGRIVNFSTALTVGVAGPLGTVGARLAYCAAKAGIEGLTRQLAKDLAGFGITVNAVVPGFVLTEPGARVRDRFEALTQQERDAMLAAFAADGLATPEDVAHVVAFLAAPGAAHVTGAMLSVG